MYQFPPASIPAAPGALPRGSSFVRPLFSRGYNTRVVEDSKPLEAPVGPCTQESPAESWCTKACCAARRRSGSTSPVAGSVPNGRRNSRMFGSGLSKRKTTDGMGRAHREGHRSIGDEVLCSAQLTGISVVDRSFSQVVVERVHARRVEGEILSSRCCGLCITLVGGDPARETSTQPFRAMLPDIYVAYGFLPRLVLSGCRPEEVGSYGCT